jgi:hypothetical protein
MDPTFWGPAYWTAMHTAAATYPEHPTQQDRQHSFEFYKSLGWVLPCAECRSKYRRIFSEGMPLLPEDLNSRMKLFEWTWRVHNMVNAQLGKPSMSLRDAYAAYAVL